jgi:hypothetical protein
MQNLNEFTNELLEKLTSQIKEREELLLINDILLIYKGEYYTYERYCDMIEYENKNAMTFKPSKDLQNFILRPRRFLLSRKNFDFIRAVAQEEKND